MPCRQQALAAAESRIGELERKALAQSQASAAQSELDTLREQVNKAARILADAQGLRLSQVETGAEKGPLRATRTPANPKAGQY